MDTGQLNAGRLLRENDGVSALKGVEATLELCRHPVVLSHETPVMPSESIPSIVLTPTRQFREELWRVRSTNAEWSCELRASSAAEGTEALIYRDGCVVAQRRFQLRDMAAMWAALEREDLIAA